MPRGGIRILFAGGGTGGHLFPGVALAELAVSESGADLFWLSTSRPLDRAVLAREGIPFEPLESPRWNGSGGFLVPLARALLAAGRRVRDFRPDVVVGVGGYGTVPPCLAAAALGVPYSLLEQNSRPGKANRFLAPGAARLYAQWDQARASFPGCGEKVRVTGSPLRRRLRPLPRAKALGRFGLSEERPTLAVVGGSQGAEVLNRGAVEGLDGAAGKLQVIHVAGAGKAEAVAEAYRRKGARAAVYEFVEDMESLYSAADLIVSRAGAMAIAEIAAFGVPAVLVPIARSAGDHQRENARAAARTGGAFLLEEPACLAGGLAPFLQRLVLRDPVFNNMRDSLRILARPHAGRAILRDLRELLGR